MEPLILIPAQTAQALSGFQKIIQQVLPATLEAVGLAGSEAVTIKSGGGFALGTLTLTANISNGDTVTIGTKTYTFLLFIGNVDGNVVIGTGASDSIDNLIAAINLTGTPGVDYALSTTLNQFVSAETGAGDTMLAIAKAVGEPGRTVQTTETSATASWGSPLLVLTPTVLSEAGTTVELTVSNNIIAINSPLVIQVDKDATLIPVGVTLSLGNNV